MTPDWGRLLYPRLKRDQRRRETRTLCTVLLIGLVVAGATGLMIFLFYRSGRF